MEAGTINGRTILADSAEWLGLLSTVTVENLPIPTGASRGIVSRLHERQRKLQAPYREKLRAMADHEIANAYGNSWCDRAKREEEGRREQEVERQLRKENRRKRLPGLRRLLAEVLAAGDDRAIRIVQRMLSEREAREEQLAKWAETAELRAAFLVAERLRLSAMSLDELLRVKTDDEGVEEIVAKLVIPKCTTVRNIAERVVLSASAVRSYLHALGIAPCFTHTYQNGLNHKVTAHYYRPDVTPAIRAEIARREQQQQNQRVQSKEMREEQRAWNAWERLSGFRKPT